MTNILLYGDEEDFNRIETKSAIIKILPKFEDRYQSYILRMYLKYKEKYEQ